MVRERAASCIHQLPAVDSFYFAMKSNNNPDVLREIVASGLGLECVSLAEVRRRFERVRNAKIPSRCVKGLA